MFNKAYSKNSHSYSYSLFYFSFKKILKGCNAGSITIGKMFVLRMRIMLYHKIIMHIFDCHTNAQISFLITGYINY